MAVCEFCGIELPYVPTGSYRNADHPRAECIENLQADKRRLTAEVERWRALAIERHHNLEEVAAANQRLVSERDKLRAVLQAVEWIEPDGTPGCCPWCDAMAVYFPEFRYKHEPDCPRQVALAETAA